MLDTIYDIYNWYQFFEIHQILCYIFKLWLIILLLHQIAAFIGTPNITK